MTRAKVKVEYLLMQPALPMTELSQWAADAETRGIWTERRRIAMPLVDFPDRHLAEIRYQVEQEWKPAFWLDLGLAQIPSRSWFEWHWQRGIDPEKIRTSIPRWIRDRVMERDGYVCQICLEPVDPSDVHLDHVKPWSLGGEHSVANLRVTHSVCNLRKAARWDGD